MSDDNFQIGVKGNLKEGIEKLIEIINTVSYGSVTVTIQDGKIVQIEKNEKVRLK